MSGKEVLRCMDWEALKRTTDYIPGLWKGKNGLM